jgi:hypothetical protein
MSTERTNDDRAAFPYSLQAGKMATGLSKREWFAGMALPGLISQVNMPNEVYAQMAVGIADEILKELEAS